MLVCVFGTTMQTLGLSESTPKPENRLKSLFWPSVQTGTDVDYLGAQGYWVCAIIAAFSFVVLVAQGHAPVGFVILLLFYLGGVGVRERSPAAAMIVFAFYFFDTVLSGISVVKIILGALLLANVRATWIASEWKPDSSEAELPPRLGDTWGDKFADKLPALLWPKLRIFYFVFSCLVGALFILGEAAVLVKRLR